MAAAARAAFACRWKSPHLLLNPVGKINRVGGLLITSRRSIKRWERPYRLVLYKRRIEAGPEPERHRSEWINWNYDCEVFAFGKRLGEEFQENTLHTAFTDKSYIVEEEKRRMELGVESDSAHLNLQHNEDFARRGEEIASRYIKAYLRFSFPLFFEEGICAVHDYLMAEEQLVLYGSNIGIGDLILCAEFPPSPVTLSRTFKALIGGLAEDQGLDRAELFVRDFILPQLVGKDISELWKIDNPMGMLVRMLQSQGKAPPEPRLIWQSASETLLSLYFVGIYSNRVLIGQSPGETVLIAEEMAARDAIKKLLNVSDSRSPLLLGKMAEGIELNYDKLNPSVKDITVKSKHSSEVKRISVRDC